ncbi:3'(2'),5'-bisphosphate nucleotidase CysQ [Shinella daejeonensis]|uniref:3'(2'),5'-bisphosphate nucleotidase CysQ n=1 Tax=Shinella daejeonensis TaxID=659017 RepID=UPI0020C7A111|nr:3'(2'),5'-bisphosphate nucleotidase CysQ [Shinella daejeonensis]MCP8897495.1 3'(2'),5'-bisphosphate nucleotidase CysQ [Shinella daejeonensis]
MPAPDFPARPAARTDWSADLDLLAAAARRAGARALEFFGRQPEVWWKNGGRSPVSAADFAANDILKEMLLSARPDYGWLSEETDDNAARLARPTVFVIDPIDGTRAFIAGKDVWCVSAAVVHAGRPVAGVLFAPALDELFTAAADGPALCNGRRLAVTPPDAARPTRMAAPADMADHLDRRSFGDVERIAHVPSLAYRLAMVADGRIDATLVKRDANDWDLAAADLLLARAGGALVDIDGTAITYNRAVVRHGTLCAAGAGRLPGLLTAARPFSGH